MRLGLAKTNLGAIRISRASRSPQSPRRRTNPKAIQARRHRETLIAHTRATLLLLQEKGREELGNTKEVAGMSVPCGFVIVGCGAPTRSKLQCSTFDGLQMKPARPLVFQRMYLIKPVLSALKAKNHTIIVQRREFISTVLLCGASIILGQLGPSIVPAIAEESNEASDDSGGGGSIMDGVLSLFDPDQMTKSGKKLPKKYIKSVKEVVKSLRESFDEDAKDNAKFRRNADSAKEAIRDYLQNWRGAKVVATEDSYIALESAFRILGEFYSKKGPQAALPEDIRTRVLEDLSKADNSI